MSAADRRRAADDIVRSMLREVRGEPAEAVSNMPTDRVTFHEWRQLVTKYPQLLEFPRPLHLVDFGRVTDEAEGAVGVTVVSSSTHASHADDEAEPHSSSAPEGAAHSHSSAASDSASSHAHQTNQTTHPAWEFSVAQFITWLEGFVAGGLAGAAAKTTIAPGDRIKIIFQVDPNRKFSLRAAYKMGATMVTKAGASSLWTGHAATLLRVVPYAAVSFASFERYNGLFHWLFGAPYSAPPTGGDSHGHGHGHGGSSDQTGFSNWSARFCAGAAAGASATTVTYPLDLLRARFAAHWDPEHKRYPSYLSAFREIIAKEGVLALYSGLRPTLIGIMPYAGTSFATFETIKAFIKQSNHTKQKRREQEAIAAGKPLPAPEANGSGDISTPMRLAAGAVSGLVAQSATYPLDIVRRRMQVNPQRYPTMTATLRDIIAQEGPKGLYKGLSMNWIKGPIAVGISFTTNDLIKRRMRAYHQHVILHSTSSDKAMEQLYTFEKFGCGAVAGCLAKLASIPYDRMKIMYCVGRLTHDMHDSRQTHMWSTMRDAYQDHPNIKLWQGSGAALLRVIPHAAVTYGAYDSYSQISKRLLYTTEPNLATDFLAGAAAATTGTAMFHPIDVLRTRAAAGDPTYASYALGLRDLFRRGGVPGLFQGLGAAVIGMAPMAGIGFAAYHGGCRYFEAEQFHERLLIGATAGVTAQLLTYPLNVRRRQALVDAAVHDGLTHSSSVAKKWRAKTFVPGLYRTMPLAWMFSTTTIGLSFAVNDACRDAVLRLRVRLVSELLMSD